MSLGATKHGAERPATETLRGIARVAAASDVRFRRGRSELGDEQAGARLPDADGHISELPHTLGNIRLRRLGGRRDSAYPATAGWVVGR